MTRIPQKAQQKRQKSLWFSLLLLGIACGWTLSCWGEDLFSYTSMPSKITVAFSGIKTTEEWDRTRIKVKKAGEPIKYKILTVNFKDYLKDVVSHESNRALGRSVLSPPKHEPGASGIVENTKGLSWALLTSKAALLTNSTFSRLARAKAGRNVWARLGSERPLWIKRLRKPGTLC